MQASTFLTGNVLNLN